LTPWDLFVKTETIMKKYTENKTGKTLLLKKSYLPLNIHLHYLYFQKKEKKYFALK